MNLIKSVGECDGGVPLVNEEHLAKATLETVEVSTVSDIGRGEWVVAGLVVTHAAWISDSTECALKKAIETGSFGKEGYISCPKCRRGYDYKVLREKES